METATLAQETPVRALGWATALGLLWIVIAAIRPDATFHLAPILIAGTPSVLLAFEDAGPLRPLVVIGTGFGGFLLAVGAALAVVAMGNMDGPAFGSFSGPLMEAIVFAGVGAVAATLFAALRRR